MPHRCSGRSAISGSATACFVRSPTACREARPRRVDQLAADLRRTGYSPLNQINKKTSASLQLAWSWGMPEGQHQPTPLVHDGIMYLPTPGGGAQALDAATGDFLWEYRAPSPAEGNGAGRTTPIRNLAIYGDKIFVDHRRRAPGGAQCANRRRRLGHQVPNPSWAYYTSGPIAVRGVIITGITGCERFKNGTCFITAHDPATGKELWRTSTVARPGEPGGETWERPAADVSCRERRLDPRKLRSEDQPDLFLDGAGEAVGARFAPDQRRRALHQQHAGARSRHGQDRLVSPADSRRDARQRRSLREHPDRSRRPRARSSRWASSGFSGSSIARPASSSTRTISAIRTLIDVDPRPASANIPSEHHSASRAWRSLLPEPSGFKSWRAMAYHPRTHAFYIPLNLTCEDGDVQRRQASGRRRRERPEERNNLLHPESPDGIGEFLAMERERARSCGATVRDAAEHRRRSRRATGSWW